MLLPAVVKCGGGGKCAPKVFTKKESEKDEYEEYEEDEDDVDEDDADDAIPLFTDEKCSLYAARDKTHAVTLRNISPWI